MSCPFEHITHYCRKMTPHIHNEKLLIHCFQETLTGLALQWYNHLRSSHIQTWSHLVNAFLKHYDLNITDNLKHMGQTHNPTTSTDTIIKAGLQSQKVTEYGKIKIDQNNRKRSLEASASSRSQ